MSVTSELHKVAMVDRGSLLTNRPPCGQDDSFKCSMLTTFSVQHREIKTIISRHWDILMSPIECILLKHSCATKHSKQYVGRTIRAFSVRVGEHIARIKSGDIKHNVPRHYREHHSRDPRGSQFFIIDKYILRGEEVP